MRILGIYSPFPFMIFYYSTISAAYIVRHLPRKPTRCTLSIFLNYQGLTFLFVSLLML